MAVSKGAFSDGTNLDLDCYDRALSCFDAARELLDAVGVLDEPATQQDITLVLGRWPRLILKTLESEYLAELTRLQDAAAEGFELPLRDLPDLGALVAEIRRKVGGPPRNAGNRRTRSLGRDALSLRDRQLDVVLGPERAEQLRTRFAACFFDTARQALRSRAQAIPLDFSECDLAAVGQWYIVLYLGVLYHMPDPVRALRRVAAVTREQAITETEAMFLCGHPEALWRFFPDGELNHDRSNWWVPNINALIGLIGAAGFNNAEIYEASTTPLSGYSSAEAPAVHALRGVMVPHAASLLKAP